jgi:MoaA/NifB/PqqE/SkfB family radical SAM enzyme
MKLDGIGKTLHQIDKIPYRPALLANIARAYFRALVLRKPTLRIVEFSITPACQSRCGYCYAAKFARKGERPLAVDEIGEVWGQAKRLGAFMSFLLGGEPTLRREFLEIVRVLEPRKNLVSFSTNAISLTEEMVVELKRMGLFVVYVSLNSLDPKVNDEVRGYPGHFDHAMRVIGLCRKHGLDVMIPVTTSKPLLPETAKILDWARENGFQSNINLFAPTGRAEGRKEELFDEEFWKELRRLYRRNPRLRGDWDTNLSLKVECPAAFEKIHVGPYGDVTGCAIQPMSFGNVRNEPLERIVEKMRGFRHFAKRPPSCLVALDREFIEDYVDFSIDQPSTPYPIELNSRYTSDCAPAPLPGSADAELLSRDGGRVL